ncbi:MAG TPA: heparan N-sulfatase [Candidatus Marinimicrobia bacterium]|nr:heparan N-sulfatase [Candidatus Neomarinimicrobiota bacterium]
MNRRDFLKNASLAALAFSMQRCKNDKPGTSGTPPPNILFCVAEDVSYPHMSAYGCFWINTPGFDSVAKEGVLFSNAYTPNAKCAPSRACILTGRNSWQLEEAANHSCFFPAKFKTYAEALSENGYYVGYTGKGWGPGVPGQINGKTRQLTGKYFDEKKTTSPARGISNSDYAANFQDLVESKPAGKPFCFWYGCHEAHRGYEYESGIKKGGKKLSEIDRVFSFWPDNETVRKDMLDYAYAIEHFDQHLQKMLNILEERGEMDNTLVVVTTDHGMPFPRIKGQAYEYSNHIPLAIMWKNGLKNPGRVVDDFVNFIDLAPTFLEVAEVNEKGSGMQPIEGKSLTDIFYSDKSGLVNAERDHVLVGKERHDVGRPHDWGYPIRGIVKDGCLYLHNFEPSRWPAGNPETGYLNCDGSPTKTEILNDRRTNGSSILWDQSFGKRPKEEFYNIKKDPDCVHNLADQSEWQDMKKKLKEQLFNELKKQGDPRMFGRGNIFDEYKNAGRNRNFYKRYMDGEKIKAGWVNETDFEK